MDIVVRAFDPCISCSAHLAEVKKAPLGNWKKQLEDIRRQGSPLFIGVGNPDRSDDALGIYIAQELREQGVGDVWLETEVGAEDLTSGKSGVHPIIFLDAIDIQEEPGKITLIPFEYMFRQVSLSHKFTPFIHVFKNNEQLKNAYILGIQPESLKQDGKISPPVREAIGHILACLLN